MSEVVWLPLDPSIRHNVIRPASSNVIDDLTAWFRTINKKSDYSFSKEFFADIDAADQTGFPMPFNSGALPIFLRLFDKYAASNNWDELIEGLDKRYR